jgi:hypothetical protein
MEPAPPRFVERGEAAQGIQDFGAGSLLLLRFEASAANGFPSPSRREGLSIKGIET